MATKLQQTIPVDNLTTGANAFADFKGWAGDITAAPGTGTGIAAALQTLGFTKLSDTYTAQWDTGTSVGATALPIAAGNLFGAAFPTTTSTARAQLAGTHFLGAWASGSYVVGDVVTYATTGLVYICIATATTQVPTDTTKWSPYWMEIWRDSSGSLTHFYIKLEYGGGATATNPQLSFQLGSAYVTNSGVLSGNVTSAEQCLVGTGVIASGECTWTGDGANYFGMLLGRNQTNTNMLWFERSISGQVSNAPVYTTQYVTFGKTCGAEITAWSGALFLSGGVPAATRVNAWTTASMTYTANPSYITNNLTPCFPVFPMVGYLGNPVTVVTTQIGQDSVEGATITATVYGALHSYLTTKTAPYRAIGTSVLAASSVWSVGLRYE